MKIDYQHPAFMYYDPISGEYNEDVNEDGVLHVEAEYKVCHRCDGHGSHFRSDLDENELINGMREDCDEEGIESYYSGSFDQICENCHGKRVEINPILPKWAEESLWHWRQSERVSNAIRDAERRVGA